MIQLLRPLLADFLSTLVFVMVAELTGHPLWAVAAGAAVGLAQGAIARYHGRRIDTMQWFGLGLTLVLGAAAFWWNDPRFVMVKPSAVHFAIGAVMLRPGWLARYLPERALALLPPALVIAGGQAWAVLMFGLGSANFALALWAPGWVWAWFISVGAVGAKVALLLGEYVLFRYVARLVARERSGMVAAAA